MTSQYVWVVVVRGVPMGVYASLPSAVRAAYDHPGIHDVHVHGPMRVLGRRKARSVEGGYTRPRGGVR